MTTEPSTFNAAQAMTQLGDDLELLGEIAELFFEDSARMLSDIESAIDLEDATQLNGTAHALKGTLANFAADQPQELARQLEMIGREGSVTGARELLANLKATVERFEDELKGFLSK